MVYYYDQYALLKALPPVCMKYTFKDESRVANIARGKAIAICHKTVIKSCILSYKQIGSTSVLSAGFIVI